MLPITPDYCPPPGSTLAEVLESLQMNQKELALRTGLAPKTVNMVIQGKAPITLATAEKLEFVTQVPSGFWMNLETQYRTYERLLERQQDAQAARDFVKRFPCKELAQRGYCVLFRDMPRSKDAILKFFGVSDEASFANTYIAPVEGAARVGASRTWDAPAFATWLRLGELAAAKMRTAPFCLEKLREAVGKIRRLVPQHPSAVWCEIETLLADCGVAAVVVKEFKGTHVYGFSRFLSPNTAILQLSLRGGRVDTFWFNLFHELAHLLKHGKKKMFINVDSRRSKVDEDREDPMEQEANAFSQNVLISEALWRDFVAKKHFKVDDITDFAQKVRVPAGVVVGRLQWEGLVKYCSKAHNDCLEKLCIDQLRPTEREVEPRIEFPAAKRPADLQEKV